MAEAQANSSTANTSQNAANAAAAEANGAHDRLPSLPRVSHDAMIVESLSRVLSNSEPLRLQGTTRVFNAFTGYLTGVCGRKIDEITPADVTKLATVLRALEELDTERAPRRHA
jgi:hypothetical protein